MNAAVRAVARKALDEGVEVVGEGYFAPVSLLNELRREALETLRKARLDRKLSQNITSL